MTLLAFFSSSALAYSFPAFRLPPFALRRAFTKIRLFSENPPHENPTIIFKCSVWNFVHSVGASVVARAPLPGWPECLAGTGAVPLRSNGPKFPPPQKFRKILFRTGYWAGGRSSVKFKPKPDMLLIHG